MQALGLRPATLLKKRLWLKCFPVNFAKFLRAPFLHNTSGWLLLTKLHEPNRRKMGLPISELRWLLNVWTCHGILCFHFHFFCLETTLQDSNWMKTISVVVMFFFPKVSFRKYLITAMFKVLYQQLRGNLTTAFERHLTTEYFMNIGVELAPRHLTYYCMLLFLSNKPSF